MFIESVMPSNHSILCCPLLLLPSIFPSIKGFSCESALGIRWPKYWSLASASVLSMNIQDWFFFFLIFFRIDSFDLLSGQGTLKSLLQHHSSKAYILQRFLYGPTLTSLHNYWKKHIFIYMDLCQQSGVCFLMKGNLTKIDLGGQKGELSYMYPLKSIRSHWMSRRKTDFLFAWP